MKQSTTKTLQGRSALLLLLIFISGAWSNHSYAGCDFDIGTITSAVAQACAGETVTLTHGSYDSAIDRQWQKSVNGGAWENVGTVNATTYSEVIQETTTYRVRMTDDCDDSGTQYTANFTITVLTPVADAGPNKSISCGEGGKQIGTASTNSLYTYSWSPTTGLSDPNAAQPVASPSSTTTYTVTVSCGSNTSQNSMTFSVNPITVSAGSNKTVSCGESVGLEGSSSISSGVNTLYEEDFNTNNHGYTATTYSTTGFFGTMANNWVQTIGGSESLDGEMVSSGGSRFYYLKSDGGPNGAGNSYLKSPAFSTSGVTDATLSFRHYFRQASPSNNSKLYIEYSTDNSSWSAVEISTPTGSNERIGAYNNFATYSALLPAAFQNKPVVYFRFRYYHSNDWYWCVDDVKVTNSTTPTITWSGGPIVSGGNTLTPTVNPTTNTTYTVTYNLDGCIATDVTNVTVTSPNPGVLPSTMAICQDVTLVLSAAGGLPTGQWQSNTGSGWNNISGATSNPYTVPTTPSVNTQYRFNSSCGSFSVTSNTLSVTINSALDCYCIPEYTNACNGNDQINKVRLVGETITIDNATGCSANFPQNFGDYTGLPAADLLEGQTYDITVTSTATTVPANERVNVWIDFNDNGVFEASEKVAAHGGTGLIGTSGPPSNYYRTFSFLIPMNTNPGQHRMRVRMVSMGINDPGDFDACSNETWGETEDYTVTIVPLVNCTNPPVAGTVNGPTDMCKYEGFTITTTGTEVSQGISYQWEKSTTGGSTWSPIPGETNTTLVVSTGIAAETLFRLKVMCSTGSTPSYSNILTVNLKPAVDCYCIPDGTTNDHEILNVTIKDVNGEYLNNTSALGENTNGYVDYTGTVPVANLSAGVPYDFSILTGPGLANHGVAVWIDFDNSGTFELEEKVLWDNNPIYPNTTFTKTLTLQTTDPVQPGIHRMRVKYRYNQGGEEITPCTDNSDSETEDYLVNITIPPPCTGTPNPGVIANYGDICYPHNLDAFTISSTGVSVGMGISYQWQQRTTGSGNGAWGNSVNGTNSFLNLPNGITNNTDFRLIVKCEGDNEAISNVITIKVKVCYCTPTGQNNNHEIVNFQLQENASPNTVVLNNSSAPNQGVNGYADYTDDLIPPNLFIGDYYRPQITSGLGSGNHGVAVWIDYNDDGIFHDDERVSYSGNTVGASQTAILPSFPVLGSPGIHRMRVQIRSGVSGASLHPCNMGNSAETEDYFVRVISKDCPAYNSPIVATGEACAGQPYSMVVKNTACDGKIYLEVRGGAFYIYQLDGTLVDWGNATSNYLFLGPFDPMVIGRQLKLVVSSGTVSIWNNGKLVVDGATASSSTEYDFVVNPVISPATFIITTPSGDVSRSIKDCRDVFMTLPLANTNFCKPININLPWEIRCDATNVLLSSGSHNVTVYPQTPGSMDDIVKINWDPNDCTWAIDPQNDCDLLDLGTVFDITPDPEGEAYLDGCFTGDRQFTAIYNGVPDSPGCCENGGPISGYAFYNIATDDYNPSNSPSYPTIYDAATIDIPAYGNYGGFATNFNLTVNVNNYCRKPFTAVVDNNDYRVYVYIDGLLAYYRYDITGNSTSTITQNDLYVDYTYLSDIKIIVLPTWNSVNGVPGNFDKNATCQNINGGQLGRWTAEIDASLNVIFEDVLGSSANCAPQATVHHVECAAIEKSDEIEHKNPIQPYYCYGNTIDLEVSGGTNIQDNMSDEVNVWYAVPGDNTTQCDMEAPFSELWNAWEYRVENLCGGASASHNHTNATVANGIANLKIVDDGTDPYVWMSPFAFNQTIDANTYKYINVRFRLPHPSSTPEATSMMQIFYTADACGPTYAFNESHSMQKTVDVTTDEWQIASFDMGSNANWAGAITGLRLDYLSNNVYVDEMDVDFIIPSKYPMVGEGRNLIIEPGDEYYTELTTTYYSKKINRCGFTECENTLVDFPGKDNASTLSGNGENTTCWVEGYRPVHFYTRDITIDNQTPWSQPAKNYVATVNPNGNEAILTIYSHIQPNVDIMAPCDDNTSLAEYHTAYMQRGFQVRVESAITDTANYDVYFPFTNPELNELINVTSGGGGDITPANTFDNVSDINDIWATKYHGPAENNTPHDNGCVPEESVVIAPTLRGTTLNHIFGLDPNYTFVPGVSPANNFVRFTVPDFSEFWFHGQNQGSPLPVTLTDFSVSCDKVTTLKWTTASEQNSDKFIIEKSRDGVAWTFVAEQSGAGNSNTTIHYSQTDNSPWSGVSYYRLRQIDYDGKEEIYGPISVSCDKNGSNISVYPNPNTGNFTVEINSSIEIENADLQLVDVTGKLVSSRIIQITKGVTQVSIGEKEYLSTGTYILKIVNTGEYFGPVKVVVK